MRSIDHADLLVKPGSIVNLADLNPRATHGFKHKDDACEKLDADIKRLSELQELFYASGQRALLIILQGTESLERGRPPRAPFVFPSASLAVHH